MGLPPAHDPSTTNPAALYAVRIHQDDRDRPGYSDTVIKQLRELLPKGAAIIDRSDLYPRESLAGTVKSVRLVDAVVMIGVRPMDRHSAPADQRIDLDPIQREIAELAVDRGVMVIVRSPRGDLHRLEDCRRTDQQGGMRLVPPEPGPEHQEFESHE